MEGHSVHMLAYLFDAENDELAGEMAEIRESRLHRARAMVDKLAELGVPVTWEQVSEIAGGGVVGRPHIARAMVEAGAVSSVAEAFSPNWIGAGGPAHVARYALDPVKAIRLVRAAGGVTVLAHPRGATRGWEMPDQVIADLAAVGLTGIEINHPQQDERERRLLSELANSLGLALSGGSDDHGALTGFRIGTDVAPEGGYEALVSQATGAKPVTGT
jgi:3',5'-nucleoside bisphosphate phosphatase